MGFSFAHFHAFYFLFFSFVLIFTEYFLFCAQVVGTFAHANHFRVLQNVWFSSVAIDFASQLDKSSMRISVETSEIAKANKTKFQSEQFFFCYNLFSMLPWEIGERENRFAIRNSLINADCGLNQRETKANIWKKTFFCFLFFFFSKRQTKNATHNEWKIIVEFRSLLRLVQTSL